MGDVAPPRSRLKVGDLVVPSVQGVMWLEEDPWSMNNLGPLVAWMPRYVGVVMELKFIVGQRSPWVKLLLPNGRTGWGMAQEFDALP